MSQQLNNSVHSRQKSLSNNEGGLNKIKCCDVAIICVFVDILQTFIISKINVHSINNQAKRKSNGTTFGGEQEQFYLL